MPKENNKMEVDIENLFKQNVNDLSSIKELYRKLQEVEEKITQIKYIDSNLANKLKKEYEKLKRIILDENVQAELNNKIEETKNVQAELNNKIEETKNAQVELNNEIEETKTEINEVSLQMDIIANKGTTVEVLERVTKEEIERQINDGTIANLTIEDNSITEEKLKCTIINKNCFGAFNSNKTYSWEGFSKTINNDGSVTLSYANDQSNDSLLSLSHELDMNLQSNHRYFVALDVKINNNTTYNSLDFKAVNFTVNKLDTENSISITSTQKDVSIIKNKRKTIKFILTTGNVSDVTKYILCSIGNVEPNNTVSFTLYNIFIDDMGSIDNNVDEKYNISNETFNIYGYTGKRLIETEVRKSKTAEIAKKLENFDKNDYIKKVDMGSESVKLFENKLSFNSNNMIVWSGYNANKNNNELNINFTNNTGNTNAVSLSYQTDFLFIKGHKYFAAIDLTLNECTQVNTSDTTTGNMDFNNLLLSGTTNLNQIATVIKRDSIITAGNRKSLKFEFEIGEQANNYNTHYIRFLPIDLNNGETLNMTIHNICIVDMGNKSYSEVNVLFNKYGYTSKIEESYNITVSKSKKADVAEVAESVKNIALSRDIELWGDSLVGQMYGDIIAQKLGRTVLSYGYGGKKSAYIRDKFLELSNKENTIIINVGANDVLNHNDVLDVDNTITNIRMMVNAIPHNRFLICTPPNGGYGKPASLNNGVGDGDFKGGVKHRMLCELERRLALEYQGHYLNTREACIYGYDMGNIKLLKSFTQPQIGNRVQISVSNATFLTTYNQNDLADFGEDFMKQIRIGSLSKADLYKVISKDSETLITVELKESNCITSGNIVSNGTDDGGSNSVTYLKVVQEADYQCFINDTTASTFRKDKIHMSDLGMNEISKHVCRAITRNCI